MAYNPFDDVILNDPAYKMQIGGATQNTNFGRSVYPTKRPDYSQETFKPVAAAISRAYKLLTPEQETLDQIEKDQQLRSLATQQAFQGTEFDQYAGDFDLPGSILQDPKALDLLNQAGFKRESFTEGLSRIGQFFYGNQRQAFEKLRDGKELTSDDRLSIALAPLDSLDFLLPPVAIKKLAGLGLKNVNSILKSTSDLPEVQQVKQFFGGSPVPLIQDAAKGPPGMVTEPRIALAKEDGTGTGAVSAGRTKLEDRPDDIKKIKDIIAAEKTKTGESINLKDAVELLSSQGFTTSTTALRRVIDAGNDLGIEAVFKPTKAEVQQIKDEATELAKIIKKNKKEDQGLSTKELVEKYGFDNLLVKRPDMIKSELKKPAKLIINQIPGYQQKQFKIRGDKSQAIRKGEFDQQLKETLLGFIEEGLEFTSPYLLGRRLSLLDKGSAKSIRKRLDDPTFKPLLDQLINKPETGTVTKDIFFKTFTKIPKQRIAEFTGVKEIKDFAPKTFNTIKQLRDEQGLTGKFSPSKLFSSFLEFRYRNVKDSQGFEKLTPEGFFKQIKYDPDDIQTLRNEFNNFLNLEVERLTMQKQTREFLEELAQYPDYKKYLLGKDGQLDYRLVNVDKAHDTPLFVTRVEGKGRLKKVGRFLNQGTEPEFLNANFQAYNSLQVRLDPIVNKLADIRVNTTLRDKASKMPFTLTTKHKNRAGEYVIPKDRVDFVSEDFVGLLNQKGANIDLNSFQGKTQLEFLTAIDQAIDKIFKERGIRTFVPTLVGKGGSKEFEIFGVQNIKNITPEKRVAAFKERLLSELIEAVKNNVPVDEFKNEAGRIKTLNRGGISMVKGGMAIGGQNFTENMNKQDFIPDPGIEGISAFDQAVQSGNLQALNIPKIFKGLGEAFGVYSPKKVGKPLTGDMSAVTPVAKSDFPLQSFTFEKITNSKTQAARPQDWINELQGGAAAPKAELLDSGLFQYLADFEKFFPNQKVSKQKLVDFLEDNPISNLKIKIKQSETGDPQYDSYMGKPRHKNVGSATIDKAGEDYREVVIEAGRLPGQKEGEEFVNSSHFGEKNVLAFGRVATYKNSAGDNVAVIQELQTDYLTQVRKEQELLDAEIKRLTLDKEKFERRLPQVTNEYDRQNITERLTEIESKLPKLLRLEESKLIKPYPNVAAADLIPVYNKQLQDIQKNINDLSMQGVRRENPEFLMMINQLEQNQKKVLDDLLDLNRSNDYEKLSEGVTIPDINDRENLQRYIDGADSYVSMKKIKTFAPTPLNSQADYVDALLKAVIKDAENRGINKIAIMPADIGPNTRWGKESEDAKRKFRNLYDKVGVQQLKNIAKKYGGTVKEEFILDTTKGELGLRFLNKNVDGEFQLLKETDIDPSVTIRREDLGPSKPPEGLNAFLNEEILRVAKDYGPNEVVFRREVAPGQTMEYFVNVKQGDVVDQKFDLVPLGDADRAENATIIIEEYNPQRVKMNVLVLPDSNKDKPMYLFKKKKGGIMPDDRLVSITDIYGDY